MSDVSVRPAGPDDLPAVAEVYGHWCRTSAVTFDTEPKPLDSWRSWFDVRIAAGPYHLLVATLDGAVAGFAYSDVFRDRRAYDTSAAVSVYCAPAALGHGLGRALYTELMPMLASQFHRAYAGIALPNPASVALHESFGFRHCGTYTEAGHKMDRFWDVAWFEKALG